MSKASEITAPEEFQKILSSFRVVVADFYAEWCQPCKTIAPLYDELSIHLSTAHQVKFVKVNIEKHKTIAIEYSISTVPTIVIFEQSRVVDRSIGGDINKLQAMIQRIVAESKCATESDEHFGTSSSASSWRIAEIPGGFNDITNQADLKGLDLLNADCKTGRVQILFNDLKPTALQKIDGPVGTKDWVESDTDEQLMLYIPFHSTLKVHSLHITSLPSNPTSEEMEATLRPKTIKIYSNIPNILGFDEAEDIPATQEIILKESDWDTTGTASIALRFVKFQNVSSLVIFIVDGIGEGCRTRIDRIRVFGEIGEKRNPGKLEKIED